MDIINGTVIFYIMHIAVIDTIYICFVHMRAVLTYFTDLLSLYLPIVEYTSTSKATNSIYRCFIRKHTTYLCAYTSRSVFKQG